MKVRLEQIAWARSGDKGPGSNVGLCFRHEPLFRWARGALSPAVVKEHLKGFVLGEVRRYELPNLLAFNYLLGDSLGGGGSESLLTDAQGKTHGQALLQLEVELPDELAPYVDTLPEP
jgi:hypothetical protein